MRTRIAALRAFGFGFFINLSLERIDAWRFANSWLAPIRPATRF
jgi:hypothetical protein